MATQWFIRHDGKISGPLSSSQLQAAALGGQLRPESPVSNDQKKWARACDVRGLQFAPTQTTARPPSQPSRTQQPDLHFSRPVQLPTVAAAVPTAQRSVAIKAGSARHLLRSFATFCRIRGSNCNWITIALFAALPIVFTVAYVIVKNSLQPNEPAAGTVSVAANLTAESPQTAMAKPVAVSPPAERARAKPATESAVDPRWRTWTSWDGKNKFDAEYLSALAGTVRLEKADGTEITIQIDDLSNDDHKWIIHTDLPVLGYDPPDERWKARRDPRWRSWTTGSDRDTFEAKYLGTQGGAVRMERADGSFIKIPIDVLSDSDHKWIVNEAPPSLPEPTRATKDVAAADDAAQHSASSLEVSKEPPIVPAPVSAKVDLKAVLRRASECKTWYGGNNLDEFLTARWLSEIAEKQVLAGDLEGAMATANMAKKFDEAGGLRHRHAVILGHIAEARAKQGVFAEAMSMANAITDPFQKRIAALNIADSECHAGKSASDVLSGLPFADLNDLEREQIEASIGDAAAQRGDLRSATDALSRLGDLYQIKLLDDIAISMARAGDFDSAALAVSKIDMPFFRATALADIAYYQAKAGHREEATAAFAKAAETLKGLPPSVASMAVHGFAHICNRERAALQPSDAVVATLERAIALADSISRSSETSEKASCLAEIAIAAKSADQSRLATRCLADARNTISAAPSDAKGDSYYEAIVEIAEAVAAMNGCSEATAWATSAKETAVEPLILLGIARSALPDEADARFSVLGGNVIVEDHKPPNSAALSRRDSTDGRSPQPLKAPFDESVAKENQQEWSRYLGREVVETNSIGLKLVLIPAGEFTMGSPAREYGHMGEREHQVKIMKPFYMGMYTVSQSEYKRIMGTNPSSYSAKGRENKTAAGLDTSSFPVESVLWAEAMTFCQKLSAKEGNRYRLPTEAEWEYACRAGTISPFNFGESLNGDRANCDGNHPYGTNERGNCLNRPTTVGSYEANAWGLYDMHGNTAQWCKDWWDQNYYANSPIEDPQGPLRPPVSVGASRVIRGAGFNKFALFCRSACRGFGDPTFRSAVVGFRVVCEVGGLNSRSQSKHAK